MRRLLHVKPLSIAGLGAALFILGTAASAGDLGQGVLLPPEAAATDFQQGPDRSLVRETCLECHSADYVTTQPRQTRAGWTAVVNRMIQTFGMSPLSTDDETRILNYLVTFYGK